MAMRKSELNWLRVITGGGLLAHSYAIVYATEAWGVVNPGSFALLGTAGFLVGAQGAREYTHRLDKPPRSVLNDYDTPPCDPAVFTADQLVMFKGSGLVWADRELERRAEFVVKPDMRPTTASVPTVDDLVKVGKAEWKSPKRPPPDNSWLRTETIGGFAPMRGLMRFWNIVWHNRRVYDGQTIISHTAAVDEFQRARAEREKARTERAVAFKARPKVTARPDYNLIADPKLREKARQAGAMRAHEARLEEERALQAEVDRKVRQDNCLHHWVDDTVIGGNPINACIRCGAYSDE